MLPCTAKSSKDPFDPKPDATHRWYEERHPPPGRPREPAVIEDGWDYLVRCRVERIDVTMKDGIFLFVQKKPFPEIDQYAYGAHFTIISPNFRDDQIFTSASPPGLKVGQEIAFWVRHGISLGLVEQRRRDRKVRCLGDMFKALLSSPSPAEIMAEIVERDFP